MNVSVAQCGNDGGEMFNNVAEVTFTKYLLPTGQLLVAPDSENPYVQLDVTIGPTCECTTEQPPGLLFSSLSS